MTTKPAALRICVRVQSRGRKSEIVGAENGRLKIKTNSPPTDGQANRDVSKQLAAVFGVPPSDVRLKSGAKSRDKIFLIDNPRVLPAWLSSVAFR